jgi:hypothetical protein
LSAYRKKQNEESRKGGRQEEKKVVVFLSSSLPAFLICFVERCYGLQQPLAGWPAGRDQLLAG